MLAGAAVAADQGSVGAQVGGMEVGKSLGQREEQAEPPSRSTCMNHCSAAETRCSSETRRARAQCARQAASGGRDPFRRNDRYSRDDPFMRDEPLLRRDDYAYFCGYFGHAARHCGSDAYSARCQARFAERYALCLDAMENNIAGMRFDCIKAERDAQSFCRDELRDCQAACQ